VFIFLYIQNFIVYFINDGLYLFKIFITILLLSNHLATHGPCDVSIEIVIVMLIEFSNRCYHITMHDINICDLKKKHNYNGKNKLNQLDCYVKINIFPYTA
jgi:hypothetical protein